MFLFYKEVACEQALWSGNERKKQRARTSKKTGRGGEGRRATPSSSPVYARLAPLPDLFLRFFPTAEPVHRLLEKCPS